MGWEWGNHRFKSVKRTEVWNSLESKRDEGQLRSLMEDCPTNSEQSQHVWNYRFPPAWWRIQEEGKEAGWMNATGVPKGVWTRGATDMLWSAVGRAT